MAKRLVLGFFFIFFVNAVSGTVWSTVEPSQSHLYETADLVVTGTVVNVEAPAGDEAEGKITVRIEKIKKGHWPQKNIIFSYKMHIPETPEFDGRNLTVEEWQEFSSNKPMRFYLWDRGSKAWFMKRGIQGWALVDDWFGYQKE